MSVDTSTARASEPTLEHPSRPEQGGAATRRHRLVRVGRVVVTLAVIGLAIAFLIGRAGQFGDGARLLAHLAARWIVLAIAAEAASMFTFAWLQRRLLRSGGALVRVRTMVEITVAENAVAATLPGGVAWAAVWAFHQLERRGVNRSLRLWMFFMAGAFSSFALFVVLAVGTEIAGSRGPVAGLRLVAALLAAIPFVALAVYVLRRPHRRGVILQPMLESKLVPGFLRRAWARVETVTITPRGAAEVLALAILNWLCDCAVLIACLSALGAAVPWGGILVIYSLTQIAAALPITPGGIGVVDASLGALLTAYGVSAEHAIAAVILYRLVSFWGLVPVGWAVWAGLDSEGWVRRMVGRVLASLCHQHASASPAAGFIEVQTPARRARLSVRHCTPIALHQAVSGAGETSGSSAS